MSSSTGNQLLCRTKDLDLSSAASYVCGTKQALLRNERFGSFVGGKLFLRNERFGSFVAGSQLFLRNQRFGSFVGGQLFLRNEIFGSFVAGRQLFLWNKTLDRSLPAASWFCGTKQLDISSVASCFCGTKDLDISSAASCFCGTKALDLLLPSSFQNELLSSKSTNLPNAGIQQPNPNLPTTKPKPSQCRSLCRDTTLSLHRQHHNSRYVRLQGFTA